MTDDLETTCAALKAPTIELMSATMLAQGNPGALVRVQAAVEGVRAVLAFDDDFTADCPLEGRAVAPDLSQGSATTCVVLTAPAGAEPSLVVFDNFSMGGRYGRSQAEASWVVDAS